jgi:hypothetical protein
VDGTGLEKGRRREGRRLKWPGTERGVAMPDDAELESDLRSQIDAAVAEGFSSRDGIVDGFTELAEEEHKRNGLEPLVARLTDEALVAHDSRQAGWIGETDCDRLDSAFASLEEQGVVARQHFT